MANGIKLGSLDISAFKVGSADTRVYLGNILLYPTFQGKWLATYTGGTTSSAECGASSAITSNEITKTNLVSVKLGQCVTSIGDDAFYNATTLSSITLNNVITSIGQWSFQGCSRLASIILPSSLTSIGKQAFFNCTSLVSITLPNSITNLGQQAFNGCTGLTSCYIGSGITNIAQNTFTNCTSLSSITIPDSVTSIGDEAFRYDYSLTNVTLPESLVSLGTRVFGACSGLTSIDIPDSLTDTGQHTFNQCTNLATVNFSPTSRLTTIGYASFANIPAMVHFDIPATVTTIGGRAFRNNTSLEKIVIPSGVTSIGEYSFDGCSAMTSITCLSTTPATLGSSAFDNTGDCPIYVPSESVDAYKSAWSTYASRIQAAPSLPTGYTQVEYVEATGQSSVNLGIQLYANVGNTFEIDCDNEMTFTSGWGQYQTFLTCMSEAGNPYPGFSNRFSNNQSSLECYFSPNSGEHQYSRTSVSGDIYTTVISCSGVPSGYAHTYPLNIFSSLDSSQSPFRYCKGKIYNMTVTLNGNLVRNLVPCVKDDQNIAGLYDLVGGVFYSSSTSSQLAAPSLIPTAYTQVEYVENTGTTYINTGFKPNQNTKIILTTQCVTSTSGGRQIGAGGYDGVNAIQFDYENGATGTLHISWGGYGRWSVYNNCVGDYNKHTYEWDGNTFYRDKGTQDEFSATTSYTTYQCTDDLAIFTRLQNGAGGGSTEAFKGKVFDFKLYDDGTLVRDLIPCYRNSDNKAGMYDIVNDVFYYPPSGDLVAGNPV